MPWVRRKVSLAEERPDLVAQWHPTRNDNLKPAKFTSGSGKQIWWKCNEHDGGTCSTCGTEHVWKAQIKNRAFGKGHGCPFMNIGGNTYICRCRTLGFKFPDIAKELVDIDPFTLTVASNKKVLWRCSTTPICKCGTVHEWTAVVYSRTTEGTGCPFCTSGGFHGQICRCNMLKFKFPDIAAQLVDGDASKISAVTGAIYTWKCEEGHTWKARVSNRTSACKTGCPACILKDPTMHGLRLDETHPELALQWHPTKNGDLTPRDVTFGSGTSVWWVCHKVDNGVCDTPGCGTVHEWQAVILNRAQAGNGCSWCHQGASNSVCRCKSLGFKYPSIAAELYDKTIDAYTISAGSSTILTWICPKKHKWNTAAATRTSGGSGCPICNVNHAETELARVLREHPCVQKFAKKRFPCTDIFNGNKVRMLEPDATGVTSSEKGFTIEADGRQHFESVNYFGNGEWTDFRDQVCRDLAKNRTAWNNGWSVLRISFEEFDNIEFWVNKFIDDIMSNDKQVAMTSNNDKYMTLKRDSEGFFQTIHK